MRIYVIIHSHHLRENNMQEVESKKFALFKDRQELDNKIDTPDEVFQKALSENLEEYSELYKKLAEEK